MPNKDHIICLDSFYPKAKQVRSHFDSQFANPHSTRSERFVWDYWFVENQYNLLRTPAEYYFPKDLYKNFLDHLVEWGRENLGCTAVSNPWLSYYIDGCFQDLHADVPHGPWAFVYSLTNWNSRKFSGGETVILKKETLNFWNHFLEPNSLELHSLVDKIPSRFNRLIVFDPRFPHGVAKVEGTRNPLEARIVIHGWFTEPQPFYEGHRTPKEMENVIQVIVDEVIKSFANSSIGGVLTFKLSLESRGTVSLTKILSNTLVSTSGHFVQTAVLSKNLNQVLSLLKFKRGAPIKITIPIIFN